MEKLSRYRPKKILEIGTLHGYSAIAMANFLLNVNNNDENSNNRNHHTAANEIIVTCLEIDMKFANIAKENIEKAGLSNRIAIIIGDALEIIPKLDKIDLTWFS